MTIPRRYLTRVTRDYGEESERKLHATPEKALEYLTVRLRQPCVRARIRCTGLRLLLDYDGKERADG